MSNSNVPEKKEQPFTLVQTLSNFFKACGPFLISQIDSSKDKYLEFKERQMDIEAGGKIMIHECESRLRIREKTFDKLLSTKDEIERYQLFKILESLDADQRIAETLKTAYLNIEAETECLIESGHTGNDKEVSEHWFDKFIFYVRQKNEDWRVNLFAKAFAVESIRPGTISTRLLWLIGMMEFNRFRIFTQLASACIRIGNNYMFPALGEYKEFDDMVVFTTKKGSPITVKNLTYFLDDLGLVSHGETCINLSAGESVSIRYFDRQAELICKEDTEITGVEITELGERLVLLCDLKPAESGYKYYDKCLDDFSSWSSA